MILRSYAQMWEPTLICISAATWHQHMGRPVEAVSQLTKISAAVPKLLQTVFERISFQATAGRSP